MSKVKTIPTHLGLFLRTHNKSILRLTWHQRKGCCSSHAVAQGGVRWLWFVNYGEGQAQMFYVNDVIWFSNPPQSLGHTHRHTEQCQYCPHSFPPLFVFVFHYSPGALTSNKGNIRLRWVHWPPMMFHLALGNQCSQVSCRHEIN